MTTDAYEWIGSSGGLWGTAANWEDLTSGADPALAPPGSGDPVTIAGPTGAIYEVIGGGGNAASLSVTGLVDLSGAYGTGGVTLGSVSGAPGTASFTSGGLTLGAGSAVMATTLSVLDGTVNLSGIGADLTASGAATVGTAGGENLPIAGQTYSYSPGAGGALTLAAGASASAVSLTVADGSVSASGTGTSLTVGGALSLGTAPSTSFVAGMPYYFGEDGSLSVTGGASVSVAGAITANDSSITVNGAASVSVAGAITANDSSITVNGAGSNLTAGGTLTLNGSGSSSFSDDLSIGASPMFGGVAGGTVQLGGLQLNAAAVGVDTTAAVLEIGTAGGAAAGAITVDAGNTITATGNASLSGNIVDNGTISETGGTLTLTGALSGSGQVQIGANSTLDLEGAAAAGDTIAFTGNAAALTIGASETYNFSTNSYTYTPYAVSAELSGFATGDGIIVDDTQLTNAVYTATGANTGTLALFAGSTAVETLSLAGNYTGLTFFIEPTTNSASAVILIAPPGTTSPPSTGTDAYEWIGSSGGLWGTAANWEDLTSGADPALAPPGSGDPVTIAGPTGAIYEVIGGGGNAASLSVTGLVDLSGAYGTGGVTLGSVSGAPGTASFTSGGLTLGAGSAVMATTLSVLDGTVNLSGIGADLTASGAATVGTAGGENLPIAGQTYSYSPGAGGALTLAAGASASAVSLTVADGSVSASGTGTSLTVGGALSLGTAPSTSFVAGMPYYFGEDGSLSVTGGASVSVAGAITANDSSITVNGAASVSVAGAITANDSSITVNGAGSNLTAGGTLTLNGSGSSSFSDDLSIGASPMFGGVAGGTVQLGGLQLNAAAVGVDTTAAVLEIGTAGGAAAGAITVDAGNTITATGNASLSGNIVDNGTISETGGTLTLTGALSGSGQVQIGANSTLDLEGAAAAGDTIAFTGNAAALTIGASETYNFSTNSYTYTPYAVSAELSGFATGDGIIVDDTQLTNAVYTATGANTGTLALFAGSTAVETLSLAGNYTGLTFFIEPTTNSASAVILIAPPGTTSPPSTGTDAYEWIGSSGGLWGTAANWEDLTSGADPALAPPGSGDPVTIAGPTGAIYEVIGGGGNAASLSVTGLVDLSGAYGTGGVTLGSVSGAPGTASFTSGGLTLGAGSAVMATTLSVLDGTVNLSGIGADLTASGAATVGTAGGENLPIAGQTYSYSPGAGGALTLAAGASASAVSLTVADGSVSASGTGTSLTVGGALSLGTAPSTSFVAGMPYYFGEDGSLSVTGGASVSVAGAITANDSSITVNGAASVSVAGAITANDSSITVNGAGSNLTAGGTLTLNGSGSSSFSDDLSIGASPMFGGVAGGTVQLGGLQLNAAAVGVDTTAAVLEIGTAGGAAAGAITVDAGNTITATGNASLSGNIVDNGTISETGGTLTLTGALSGSGQVQIGANSTLDLEGAAAAGDTIAFTGNAAALTIGASETYNFSTNSYTYTPYAVSAELSGFATGDGIIVDDTQLTNAVYTATGANTGTLALFAGSTAVETLSLAGNYTGLTFFIEPTTNSASAVTLLSRPGTTVPSSEAVLAGVTTPLTGFSVTDTNAMATGITITLTDATGELSATDAGGGTVIGAGTDDLVISGSLTQANADLATLTYLSDTTGSDTINLDAVDSLGSTALRASVAVTVVPAEPPVITVPTGAAIARPGAATPISSVTIADADAVIAGETVTVTLRDSVGLLSANTTAPGGGGTITGSDSNSLAITGTLTAVDADLSTLTYLSTTPGSDTVTVAASGTYGGAGTPATFTVLTSGPPVITAPTSATVGVGQADAISGIIVGESPAISGETFTVTLTDNNGELAATGTGVSGSGTTSLTISGSLTQVNADLATLTDTEGTTASDTIALSASDGLGGMASQQSVAVTVNGVPTTSAPATATVQQNQPTAIAGISLSESGAQTPSLTGLEGYWTFNGTGNDLSGNGNNLVLDGGATFASGGQFGQALSLDGNVNSNAQETANNTAFDLGTGDFTIQLWADLTQFDNGSGNPPVLIEKFAGQSGPGWTLYLTGANDDTLQFYANGSLLASAPVSTALDQWQEYVVERSGNTLDVYFDDALVASTNISGSLGATTNPLLIGARDAADGRNFTMSGLIDDVAIWNRALSPTEIEETYNNENGIVLAAPAVETFTATLADSNGVLAANTGAAGGGGTITSSNGGTTLTVAGTLAQVNADLTTLTDDDPSTAADTITVNAKDSFGNSAVPQSIAVSVTPQTAPILTTLVSFNGTDGDAPTGGLIADVAGDLFGTATQGGANGDGAVFELPKTAGTYASVPTLISFDGTEGIAPTGGLVADAAGDLFGVSSQGGANGDGTVFEIAQTNGSATAPAMLVSFDGTDGAAPAGTLIADFAGDLFGTTTRGGTSNDGTVFEIPNVGGGYASAPTTLATFDDSNGLDPTSGLIADANGDLFGTTAGGGADGDGTVFELVNNGDGTYSLTTLITFDGGNGLDPSSGLIADLNGDLFGTTVGGGANGDGTVYEIPYFDGSYASTPTILVSFDGADAAPSEDLTLDGAGNLFGTTTQGGANGDGTVFEIPNTTQGYASTPTTLASFDGTDGATPNGGLIAGTAGNLYGTTEAGGANGDGSVFELTGSGFQIGGPPVITAPATTVVVQGFPTPLGVSVAELGNVSAETFTVSISDSDGLLSASGSGVTGSGGNSLSITGSLADVNTALGTLTDTDPSTAPDSISVQVADSLGNAASTSVGVTVAPLAAQFSGPAQLAVVNGVATPIGVSLATSGDLDDESLTATVTSANGALSASGNNVTGSGGQNLVITGSLPQVNAAFATLTYTDAPAQTDNINISVSDGSGNVASTSIGVTTAPTPPSGGVSDALFYAILSMDAYYRQPGGTLSIGDPGDARTTLGGATNINYVSSGSGFFATVWTYGGKTVIVYRGTDELVDVAAWQQFLGSPFSTQGQEALQLYENYNGGSFSYNPNIILTGHSLGGGLAGWVAGHTGASAITYDAIGYSLALANEFAINPVAYLLQYGMPPNFGTARGYYLFGEVAAFTRIPFIDMASPVYSYAGLLQIPILTQITLHSSALLAIYTYAQNDSAWHPIGSNLFSALTSNTIASAIGVSSHDIMDAQIAYSALQGGGTPFGTTGIASMFHDADALGQFYSSGDVPDALNARNVMNDLVGIAVEYGGFQAETAQTSTINTGVVTYDQSDGYLKIDVSASTWTDASAPLNTVENPQIVNEADLINSIFGDTQFASVPNVDNIFFGTDDPPSIDLSADNGTDLVYAGDGTVSILAGSGTTDILAGAGTDTVNVNQPGQGLNFAGASGTSTIDASGLTTDELIDVLPGTGDITAIMGQQEILGLDDADTFQGSISGFVQDNVIDLVDTYASSAMLGPDDALDINSDISAFSLQLTGANYTGDFFETTPDGQGGTDIKIATLSITPVDPTLDESPGSETFTITRFGDVSQAETIYVSTTDGTTVPGESINSFDFAPLSYEPVTFAAGDDTTTVTLTILGDDTSPGTKLFGLQATDGVTATANVLGTDTFTFLPPPQPPTGGALGCPHFTTFDGLEYDFQGAGEFVAAKSTLPGNTFQVQLRIEPEGSEDSSVSIITMIGVQVGSDRVTFAADRSQTSGSSANPTGGPGSSQVVWVDGAPVNVSPSNPVYQLAGGTVTEVSPNEYVVALNTGEVVTVNPYGDGMGLTITLGPNDDPGSVQGLFGPDEGQANDFQLPDGTVLQQSLTQTELYQTFANAWRVTDATSLLDYGPGQDTETFTNTMYPREILTLADFPSALVSEAAALAAAAGITNPTLAADAEFDYLTMGDPSYFSEDAAVGRLNPTTQTPAVITQPVTPPPSIGLVPADPEIVETSGATTPVIFIVNLTSAATSDTVVDYAVASPSGTTSGKNFLDAADFGGTLPSGSVTISAGETEADITIEVPNSASGSTPSRWLMLTVSSPSGDLVYDPAGQTEIVNSEPVAGNPAQPVIELLPITTPFASENPPTLTQSGNSYTVDLGQVLRGTGLPLLQFAIANMAAPGADNLSAAISTITGDGFQLSGTEPPGTIAAGSVFQDLYLQPDTTTLGAQSKSLTVTANDVNDTGYTAALPDITLTVEDTIIAPAQAVISPQTIQFPNVRVGTPESQAITVTNSAAAGAANLDVTLTAGGGTTATGSISQIAPGASDSTDLSVGLSTSAAGLQSGTVTVNLFSDLGNGMPLPTVPSPQITVTGSIYREASAGIAVADAIVHVGDPGSDALVVTNTDPADGYSENLIASLTATTGDLGIARGGPSGDIAAGASDSTTLAASLSTAMAGTVSGTATVALTSDGGTGPGSIDGLGQVALPAQDVPVNITVDNYAQAALADTNGTGTVVSTDTADDFTLDLGAVALGASSYTIDLAALNAAVGPADLLSGEFKSPTSAAFTNMLSPISGIAAGGSASAGSMVLNTGTVGTFSETITFVPTGSNASGYSAALPAETLIVTAQVVAVTGLASAAIETASPIALGSIRTGGVLAEGLNIENSATAPAEDLDASVGSVTGAATASGSISLLPAGQTDDGGITVGLNTTAAGAQSGTVTLNFASDGAGTDGNGVTALSQQSATVTGDVYREAIALVGVLPSPLIVHVGDAAPDLSATNTAAADGYSENLIATVTATTGNVTASGSTGDVAPQATNTAIVLFSTVAAATISGSLTLNLQSDGTGIDGFAPTSIGTTTVDVSATVDNYAAAGLAASGGGVFTADGTNSAGGANYTLDLGTFTEGSDAPTIDLAALNTAAGPADLLSGSFSETGSSAFANALSSFSDLTTGGSDPVGTVSLSTATAGMFSETITLAASGSNASGYDAAVPDATLTIEGTVAAPSGLAFNLTTGPDTLVEPPGSNDNTVIATTNTLSAGDDIDPGNGGGNTLVLQGTGVFNMTLPATLADIDTVKAQEGQASYVHNGVTYAGQTQIVDLRSGLDATVDVAPATVNPGNPNAPTITIVGATGDDSTINLASGNDAVTLGSAQETVNGGGGNNTFYVNGTTIGATINGGSGTNLLEVTGGGTMAMGGNIQQIADALLIGSSTPYDFTANTLSGLLVDDVGTTTADTLVAGGSNQSLTGGGAGKLTMDAANQSGGLFKDTASTFNGDTVKDLVNGDMIDITGLAFSSANTSLGFAFNSGPDTTTMSVLLSGTQKTAISLLGQYMASDFSVSADTSGTGTLITLNHELNLSAPH